MCKPFLHAFEIFFVPQAFSSAKLLCIQLQRKGEVVSAIQTTGSKESKANNHYKRWKCLLTST